MFYCIWATLQHTHTYTRPTKFYKYSYLKVGYWHEQLTFLLEKKYEKTKKMLINIITADQYEEKFKLQKAFT